MTLVVTVIVTVIMTVTGNVIMTGTAIGTVIGTVIGTMMSAMTKCWQHPCEQTIFIPRIPLILKDMPQEFKRLQFLVKVSFTMFIYKSWGETLKTVGLHLIESRFSHDQLYVRCSTVGNGNNLFILIPNGKTKRMFNKLLTH